jgi:hypothetical protein
VPKQFWILIINFNRLYYEKPIMDHEDEVSQRRAERERRRKEREEEDEAVKRNAARDRRRRQREELGLTNVCIWYIYFICSLLRIRKLVL